MRFIIFLLYIFIVKSHSQRIPEDIQVAWKIITKPYHNACVMESHIDPYLAENWVRDFHMPDTPAFGCFIKCLYLNLNFMKPDGAFDVHEMVDVAHYMTHDLARICLKDIDVEKNHCKRSYKLGTCIVNSLVV
ncbi:general odorant-binding protein 99b-like [Photinus pyralis]|uniref:general odorant-binding protein 99b-like n=1 Tax=Photinus pyralis TaxID=7054 RepID=UPI001266F86B|nr:general odorant-binding protein 99b-like [Photinus pyralis]XP_031343619.1 general odorant-binding protein 99b-like [Photinus pyralis]